MILPVDNVWWNLGGNECLAEDNCLTRNFLSLLLVLFSFFLSWILLSWPKNTHLSRPYNLYSVEVLVTCATRTIGNAWFYWYSGPTSKHEGKEEMGNAHQMWKDPHQHVNKKECERLQKRRKSSFWTFRDSISLTAEKHLCNQVTNQP